MKPWKTNRRRDLLDCGKFLRVEEHEVELPDGTIIPDWPWVISPDFINVVAITPEHAYLFFRQTKYAIEGTALAPVGGYLEPGEDPLETAKRELQEETGYQSDDWTSLGAFPADANRGCGTGHFYLARDCRYVGGEVQDDLEEQELLLLSRAEVEAALDQGEIKVMSWVACVAMGLRKVSPADG
ncbi:MAG: ADP-ribose pyrophosphatase [Candidatus Omnitrophota bacterium]